MSATVTQSGQVVMEQPQQAQPRIITVPAPIQAPGQYVLPQASSVVARPIIVQPASGTNPQYMQSIQGGTITGPTQYVSAPQVAGQPVTYTAQPIQCGAYTPSISAYTAVAPMEQAMSGVAGATQAPLVYPQPGEYTTYASAPLAQYGACGMQAGFGCLQPAPSMVAYPGSLIQAPAVAPTTYVATSVQQAWNNHFAAFGQQDLDKIMLDYDETSVIKVWHNATSSQQEFRGLVSIREFFSGVFKELSDLATLEAPVQDIDEEMFTVFLIWHCPSSGIKHATDTFIFGHDYKIKRQNVVLTKQTLGSGLSAASPATKKSSQKKKKGYC